MEGIPEPFDDNIYLQKQLMLSGVVLLMPHLKTFLHVVLLNLNWLDIIIGGIFLSSTVSGLLMQPLHKWAHFLKIHLLEFLPILTLCFWRHSLEYAEENCAKLLLDYNSLKCNCY